MRQSIVGQTGLLLAVMLVLGGCTVADRDVSHDPKFLIGYRPGQVYRLIRPAGVLEIDEQSGELIPPRPIRGGENIVRTLPAGTAIDIISLRYTVTAAPVQWETGVTTLARVDGENDYAVDLSGISTVRWITEDRGMKTGILCPDPHWLVLDGAAAAAPGS